MSYSDLPMDYKNTFSRYVCLFKCIGIDFFDVSKSYLNINNIKLLLFSLAFFPFVLGQFTLISHIRADNFLESVRVVPVDLMFFQDIVKMVIAVVRRSEIRDMMLEVGELWPKDLETGNPKAVILKAWLRRIKIPLDLFFIFAMTNLSLFEVIPFLISVFNICKGVDVYLFPFQPTNFWDVNSLFSYLVTYLWELAGTVPCQMCLYLPFDITIMIMTSNVSALFRLLQVDLKNTVEIHDEDHRLKKSIYVSDPESYEEVKRIVKIHQRLLRIADQLNSIFGLVIFIHVAFAALEICFFGFLTVVSCLLMPSSGMMQVYGGLAETIANLLTVLNAVFTIFLLALSGQFLCDTSSQVADAAYHSYWYESDVKVKKLIFSIIIRAQRPSYLSALGFSQLTLKSFSKIMSSAWTYFSLLIQVYEET